MAKTTQWLNAILDYMKKSNISTVHAHPPGEVFSIQVELIKRPTRMEADNCLYRHIATWLVGGWEVQAVIYF